MSLRNSPAAILRQKMSGLSAALEGKTSASSSSISASYGLPIEEVRRAFRSKGVTDNG